MSSALSLPDYREFEHEDYQIGAKFRYRGETYIILKGEDIPQAFWLDLLSKGYRDYHACIAFDDGIWRRYDAAIPPGNTPEGSLRGPFSTRPTTISHYGAAIPIRFLEPAENEFGVVMP